MPANHNILNIEQIESVIPQGKLSYFEAIDSTNSWLLKHGQCGDICISEMQKAGRGRRGNLWLSPNTGNIYFSLCWCFDVVVSHLSLLGLVTGVAIAEALAEIGLTDHGIKWPNDIFWQQKKLGGILIETVDQSGRVIIGIGLNIELPKDVSEKIDQKAVGLDKAMQGLSFSREQLISALIKRLYQHLKEFVHLDFDEFISTWNQWDILRGKIVSFIHQGIEVTGEVMEIDQHGRIGVILADSNEIAYFSSADIRLRKANENAAN
jgi:BirA family biotin operon repressor/biotin-[acetyl-CoA-carboxylase] ligase